MRKRIVSVIVSAALSLSALPVLAEETVETEIIRSGLFTFVKNTGEIVQCNSSAEGEIIVPAEIDGTRVKSIRGFISCPNITSVIVSDGIEVIGKRAFAQCDNLESVTLPESVTDIEYYAFKGCGALKSIKLPSKLETLGLEAFSYCSSLEEIELPASLTSVSGDTFMRCGKLNITVSDENGSYSAHDGVLFNKNKTTLIAYAKDDALPVYTVPEGVTKIGNNAFEKCYGLTGIIFPETLEKINRDAFTSCGSLAEISYAGSESDWDNVSILGGNSEILNALVHFNAVGINPPQIDGTPVYEDGYLRVTIKDSEYDSTLVTVFYNGGAPADIQLAPVSAGDTSKLIPITEAESVKVFIWSGISEIYPLCEAVEIKNDGV